MGAYLSEPDTEKHSQDENVENVKYGASSMQGWRATQEDAHNCIPRFDDDASLFAVYDGHGGAEVAQYCSMYLPNYIKLTAAYKKGNVAQGLEDAFLGFDETLTHANVINELKQMAGNGDRPSDTENEVNHLFAEANMPLDEVLAKYKSVTGIKEESLPVNPILARLKKKEDKPQSPFLRAKQGEGIINSHDKSDLKPIIMQCDKDGEKEEKVVNGDSETVDVKKPDVVDGDLAGKEKEESAQKDKNKVEIEKKKNEDEEEKENSSKDSEVMTIEKKKTSSEDTKVAGNEKEKTSSSSCDTSSWGSSSSAGQAGCSTGKRSRNTVKVVLEDDEDSSSSEDENYDGEIPYADSDSDKPESGEEALEDDDEDDDDDEDEYDEDEDDYDEDEDDESIDLMEEDDEKTCGCTAVVALLRGDELYVANAGDSRCIVCRNGKAIDMSVDHKPEDELERKRIEKAGGKVTADGRVNGGLNLSRAIGDHTYKHNQDLPAKEQMITALPDIRTLTIDPEEDEFMVLACDGIWNSMSSQEVSDFVRDRIKKGTDKLTSICESLFDNCLATNTEGDGTGCDNMTVIIVEFKNLTKLASKVKRSPKSDNETSAKKIKIDEVSETN